VIVARNIAELTQRERTVEIVSFDGVHRGNRSVL
jgi:FAD synthase